MIPDGYKVTMTTSTIEEGYNFRAGRSGHTLDNLSINILKPKNDGPYFTRWLADQIMNLVHDNVVYDYETWLIGEGQRAGNTDEH